MRHAGQGGEEAVEERVAGADDGTREVRGGRGGGVGVVVGVEQVLALEERLDPVAGREVDLDLDHVVGLESHAPRRATVRPSTSRRRVWVAAAPPVLATVATAWSPSRAARR